MSEDPKPYDVSKIEQRPGFTAYLRPDGGVEYIPLPAWVESKPGDYPWDRWKARAIDAGLPKDLADLGRSVFRNCLQHERPSCVLEHLGFNDDGDRALELAIAQPVFAHRIWMAGDDEIGECMAEEGSFD